MHSAVTTDNDTDNEPTRDDKSAQPDTGDTSANVRAPFAPHRDDDSAFGDTDQHSTA